MRSAARLSCPAALKMALKVARRVDLRDGNDAFPSPLLADELLELEVVDLPSLVGQTELEPSPVDRETTRPWFGTEL